MRQAPHTGRRGTREQKRNAAHKLPSGKLRKGLQRNHPLAARELVNRYQTIATAFGREAWTSRVRLAIRRRLPAQRDGKQRRNVTQDVDSEVTTPQGQAFSALAMMMPPLRARSMMMHLHQSNRAFFASNRESDSGRSDATPICLTRHRTARRPAFAGHAGNPPRAAHGMRR